MIFQRQRRLSDAVSIRGHNQNNSNANADDKSCLVEKVVNVQNAHVLAFLCQICCMFTRIQNVYLYSKFKAVFVLNDAFSQSDLDVKPLQCIACFDLRQI